MTHKVFISLAKETPHASAEADAPLPEVVFTARSQQTLLIGFFGTHEAFGITGEADNDYFSAPGHTLGNGDRVVFPVLTGGTGLTAGSTPYFVRDVSSGLFKVALTEGGPAVNFTTDVTSGTCQYSPEGQEVSGWVSGRCAFKQYPESSVLILDAEIEEEGTGADARYKAEWTHITNDSAALREFIKGQTLPRPCWFEIEWTDGSGTHRVSFPVLIVPAFISPDDGAPDPADPAALPWLLLRALVFSQAQTLTTEQRTQALENLGLMPAEDGTVTWPDGRYLVLNTP